MPNKPISTHRGNAARASYFVPKHSTRRVGHDPIRQPRHHLSESIRIMLRNLVYYYYILDVVKRYNNFVAFVAFYWLKFDQNGRFLFCQPRPLRSYLHHLFIMIDDYSCQTSWLHRAWRTRTDRTDRT